MGRPNRSEERRAEFVPTLARTFAEFGYRRTTTAVLAERCGLRENVLYRLWPDKRAMFVAALDHVYAVSAATWRDLLDRARGGASAAERILEHEARHHGEYGLYRLVFAGLSETDDAVIAAAMRQLYTRFQRFIAAQVTEHRDAGGKAADAAPDAGLVAWAIVGLGTVANIGRELDLLSARARRQLFAAVGGFLLGER